MIDNPSPVEAIKLAIQKAILALHTAMPGVVVSYDASTQTANVRPLLKWQAFLPGQLRSMVELPVLESVLVCHPRAGTTGVHLPLAADDLVLLVFCSRSLTSWRSQTSGTRVTDPGRALTPTPLEAAVALPLMTHDSAPWATLSGGSTINIGDDGGALDFVALAQTVLDRLNQIKTDFDAHTHTTTATVSTGPLGVIAPPTSPMTTPTSVACQNVKVT